jgi:hypothetical protein
MKDNLGNDYFLLAHVDADKARFSQSIELGMEFRNSIDAWNKMAFKFRGGRTSDLKYAQKDLRPLIYGMRTALD